MVKFILLCVGALCLWKGVEAGLTYDEFVEKYNSKIIALSWAISSGEPFTYKKFEDLPGITRKKVEKLRKLFDKKNKEAGVK